MPTKNPRTRKLILILSVVLLLLAIFLITLGLWPYKNALLAETRSWQQLDRIITPHMTIETPGGNGPFPVVVVIPGCEGVKPERAKPRMQWLVNQGYMAVMIDSHTGRGLDEDAVCGGYALWGAERAGDIYISLDYIRKHPKADKDKIALLGYSHGGWSILDALSYNGKAPYALTSTPSEILKPVKAAVIYYPYCDFPSRARYQFNSTIPLLTLNAEQDTTVNPRNCEVLMQSWQKKGLPVTSISYPGAAHAFDVNGHKNYDKNIHQKALDEVSEFLRSAFKPKTTLSTITH